MKTGGRFAFLISSYTCVISSYAAIWLQDRVGCVDGVFICLYIIDIVSWLTNETWKRIFATVIHFLHCMTKLGRICDEIRQKIQICKILHFLFQIAITNLLIIQINMWKYRLDFNLSYYVLFVNIGFVFCTLEHHCKQYDEILCIDGTWILAQNG